MKHNADKKNLAILFSIAVILFIVLSVLLQLPEQFHLSNVVYTDAKSYMRGADYLYNHHLLADPIRPFGYPWLIGLPHLLGKASTDTIINFAVFLNCIFSSLSLLLIYRITSIIANSKTAFIVALLYILCISNLLILYQAMTETFFILMILCYVYFLLKYFKEKRYNYLLLALFFISYSVTVRPIGLYFAIITFIVCIFLALKQKKLRNVLVASIILLGTIGLQCTNMYRTYGKFTLSFIQDLTLERYLITKADYYRTDKSVTCDEYYYISERRKDSSILAKANPNNLREFWAVSSAQSKASIHYAVKYSIKNILLAYVYNMRENSEFPCIELETIQNVKNLPAFKSALKAAVFITKYQNYFICRLLLLFSAVWLYFSIRYFKRLPPLYYWMSIVLLTTNYFFFVSGISFWQGDRFNFVWYHLLFICVAYFVHHFKQIKNSGKMIAGE